MTVRRRRLFIAASLAIAVLVALPAALVVALDVHGLMYRDPLRPGSTQLFARVCTDPTDAQSCEQRPPEPGGPLLFGFSIRNPGRLPTTLLDVSLHPVLHIDDQRVRTLLPEQGLDLATPASFAPFTLAQGDERTIILSGTVDPCMSPGLEGTGLVITYALVRYRWLFVEHQQQVPLGFDIPLGLVANNCYR